MIPTGLAAGARRWRGRWRRPGPAVVVLAAVALVAAAKGGVLIHALATGNDTAPSLGDWPDQPIPTASGLPALLEPAAGPGDPDPNAPGSDDPDLEDPNLEDPNPEDLATGPDLEPGADRFQDPGASALDEPAAAATAVANGGSEPVPHETPDPDGEAVAGLSAEQLTSSEIAILNQLAARRTQLEERERQLRTQLALVETAEAKLIVQTERLERLRAEIEALINRHDEGEEAKLASLVKIYETMKPKAAAEIFNRLEMPILLQVVERMREPKSADVLARMDPVRAKQVTAELAKRTPLPPLDDGA